MNNGQETVTGDDVNGSTNTELLGGRKISTADRSGNSIRQQSENSQKISSIVGRISLEKGRNEAPLRAGDSGWIVQQSAHKEEIRSRFEKSIRGKISKIAPSGVDTIGREISNEIKEKFKNTVFKDENGNLLSLYHWTPNAFSEFKYGDGVFHLGTLTAALTVKHRDAQQRGGYILEAYVLAKNPLIIRDDGRFGAYSICKQLMDYGIMSQSECNRILEMEGFFRIDMMHRQTFMYVNI